MAENYNPLDKFNLGKSVVEALLNQPAILIADVPPFAGAGIYAIYYHGDFGPYQPISGNPNRVEAIAIYIGKAVPAGSRRGRDLSTTASGSWLYRRIIDHLDSIKAVEMHGGNLKASDFSVRYLTVDDIWIPLGESLLISTFNPLWNRLIEGFGNHDPGAGRYNGLRPVWDMLHPGRHWAARCRERSETVGEIILKIERFFEAG